jgi:hypothetical protein
MCGTILRAAAISATAPGATKPVCMSTTSRLSRFDGGEGLDPPAPAERDIDRLLRDFDSVRNHRTCFGRHFLTDDIAHHCGTPPGIRI